MSLPHAQIWRDSNFTIERTESPTPGKLILRFSGPLTTRSMYLTMSPDAVRSMLNPTPMPGEPPTTLRIFDLSGVPYIDSSGMGLIATEYVRSRNSGIPFIAAAASPRVLEVFRLTKLDAIIPMSATVEDAVKA